MNAIHVDLKHAERRLIPEQEIGENIDCGVHMEDGGYWLLYFNGLVHYSNGSSPNRVGSLAWTA